MVTIHENDKMTYEPLTNNSCYQGYWISKERVLCALKGYQSYLQKRTEEFIIKNPAMSFAFADAQAILEEWFPILQSETLKTTDDGNAHLPQSNQTEDVRTSESLVGGSEQTSINYPVYIKCWSNDCKANADYISIVDSLLCAAYCAKDANNYLKEHGIRISFSQPSSKASRSSEDEVSKIEGSRSRVADAGELMSDVGAVNVKDAGESPSHIFRRFRCVHCDRFFHKEERAGSNEGKPVCRECIDCNEEEEVGGRT